MNQIFAITFTILGQAASYDRTVLVVATSSREAKEKIKAHFKDDVKFDFGFCTEILGKFSNDIFALPVLAKIN